MNPLPEGFACEIINNMDHLFIQVSLPTGGRMTKEEAERLSVHLWSRAQEVRSREPQLALEIAKRTPRKTKRR